MAGATPTTTSTAFHTKSGLTTNGAPSAGPLLHGMQTGTRDDVSISILEIQDTGEERIRSAGCPHDLSRMMWPDEDAGSSHACSRALRDLADVSRRDFWLREWRRGGYLVRSDFIRVVAEPTRVLFLLLDNPTFRGFLTEFRSLLAHRTSGEERLFPVWTVECLLCASVSMYTMRLDTIRPVFHDFLAAIDLSASTTSLESLYPLKTTISRFIEQVKPLVQCLRDLLDNEVEHAHASMASVLPTPAGVPVATSEFPSVLEEGSLPPNINCQSPSYQALTSVRSRRYRGSLQGSMTGSLSIAVGAGSSPHLAAHVACQQCHFEEVLDTWEQSAREVMADAIEMNASIEDAIMFLQASMSVMRTKLLRWELAVQVVHLALSFGALMFGIFGMNLQSLVFHAEGWFEGVLVGVLGLMLLIMSLSYAFYKASKYKYKAKCDEYGRNVFFQKLDDDGYVLRLGSALEGFAGNSMSQHGVAALNTLMNDLKTPAPMRSQAMAAIVQGRLSGASRGRTATGDRGRLSSALTPVASLS